VDPDRQIIGGPLTAGEGEVIADLDFGHIDARKRLMHARSPQPPGTAQPLLIDRIPASPLQERAAPPKG